MPPLAVQDGVSVTASAEDKDGWPRVALVPAKGRQLRPAAQLLASPLVSSGGGLPGWIWVFSAASSLSTSASAPA